MVTRPVEGAAVRRLPVGSRVPPHDLDAEESLLGAMLLSRDAIAAAMEACVAEDFYKPAHAHIYSAVMALYARGEPADPVTVADELRRSGLLEAVGDASVLISLQVNTPSTTNAAHYAHIVEEHSLLRRLVAVAGEIAELGYSVPEDVAEVVDRAEAMVFEVAQRRMVDTMAPLRDLLADSLDHLENLFARGEHITGVPTGYADLDDRLAGLQKSNLVVVGARPAMGKTSFALGIVRHAAVHARVPVLLFSLEMSHLELTQRLLCSEAHVDASRMRNGRLLESDWPRISDAIGRLGDAPIYIDDNPNLTVMDIRAKSRRLKARDGLGLVVVDYLQLMSGHGKSRAENRQVEVSEISRGLKVLARELDVPVIALSQLSRNLEMRQDKRPVLADLRESGCLTADTRVTRADSGQEVTLGEMIASGATDVPVWTLDAQMRTVAGRMSKVFSSGTKPVFELRLASGRRVTASANHPFRTPGGWRSVADLAPGELLATPRRLPSPLRPVAMPPGEVVVLAHLVGAGRTPLCTPPTYTTDDPAHAHVVARAVEGFGFRVDHAQRGPRQRLTFLSRRGRNRRCTDVFDWLVHLGLHGRRRTDVAVPAAVFSLPDDQLATFLRHLWSTSGGIWPDRRHERVRCRFTTSSRALAEDVQTLLLRFGVASRVVEAAGGRCAPAHHVSVHEPGAQRLFLAEIGVFGAGAPAADAAAERLDAASARRGAMTGDRSAAVTPVLSGRGRHPSSVPAVACDERPGPLTVLARPTEDGADAEESTDTVWWDQIVAIVDKGEAPVFDATVPGTHNFLANGIVAHNSIEQDADVVLFLYRDELYNSESNDRGKAEVAIAKHRNGPTGVTELAFVDRYARFNNMARE